MDVQRYRAPLRMPPISTLCADIRDGVTTAELARELDIGESWIRTKIRDAGYDPDTGRAPEREPKATTRETDVDLSWRDDALCAQTGIDDETWYPNKGGTTQPAKRLCTRCEVRAECLDYALANDERFGVWGGLSERERRRLQRLNQRTEPTRSTTDEEEVPA